MVIHGTNDCEGLSEGKISLSHTLSCCHRSTAAVSCCVVLLRTGKLFNYVEKVVISCASLCVATLLKVSSFWHKILAF